MCRDVKDYVKMCHTCQQVKVSQLHPTGLLQPLPIPIYIWEDIAMDFITGSPLIWGFSVIFVVVDRLSKYNHFVPLRWQYTSHTVVEAFL